MSDPRNAAHDKKVQQGKGNEAEPSHDEKIATTAAEVEEHESAEHEKSVAVLSKLKEMEFYSRANLETLAGLMLTIDDELKQKEFSDPMGNLYGAQAGFQTSVTALIESYTEKCESLKPTE